MKNLHRHLPPLSHLLPLALGLGTLLLALGLLWGHRGIPQVQDRPPGRATGSLGSAAVAAGNVLDRPGGRLDLPAPRGPSRSDPPPTEADPALEALATDELVAALERIARVPLTRPAELEAALAPVLTGDVPFTLLRRLREGSLPADASPDGARPLSPAETGGVRALVFALILFADPDRPPPTFGERPPVDGPALLSATLDSLPAQRPPVREGLVELLRGARRPGGEPLLDLSHAPRIEALVEAHPGMAELLRSLLADLSAGLDPDMTRAQDLWTLVTEESPRLLGAALGRLLESDAPYALAWATTILSGDEASPGLSPDLRRAITTAVAAKAPVELAAGFFADHASEDLLAELYTLGSRPGGLEGLRAEYERLRNSHADSGSDSGAEARARALLVAGMDRAPLEDLLALAQTDPDPRVRGQAWTTATSATSFQVNLGTLGLLADTLAHHSHPDLGAPTYALVSSATNMARRAAREVPQLLPACLDLLRGVAADRSLDAGTRELALQGLRPWLSAEELAELRG